MWRPLRYAVPAALLLLAACRQPVEEVVEPPVEEPPVALPSALELIPSDWDAMAGWASADLTAARAAFLRSCERLDRRADDEPLNPRAAWAGTVGDWRPACAAALMAADEPAALRALFETLFLPIRAHAVAPETGDVASTGRMTGYYEPYVEVRETPEPPFTQPLRARPDDLVTVDLGLFDSELAGRRLVGQVENGRLVFYKERDEIEALDAGEPFAWGRPIDVFFLQIQGSGRIVYPDGRQERAAFAAHNGQPYRSIGRELIQRGELASHAASKDGIEAWLNENGPEATAELFAVNPRYVFFGVEQLTDPALGPRGSSGVALTPMASIAVDPAHHAHGVPVWFQVDNMPELENWTGLVITQDAGGAITGPLRADFFWGWGETAERRAGRTRADASWTILLPVAVAERIVDTTPPA